jgi:hypothetical protein
MTKPFRTETTLLPDTRVIEWSPGQCIRVLTSLDAALAELRTAVADEELEAAAEAAGPLREVLAEAG